MSNNGTIGRQEFVLYSDGFWIGIANSLEDRDHAFEFIKGRARGSMPTSQVTMAELNALRRGERI